MKNRIKIIHILAFFLSIVLSVSYVYASDNNEINFLSANDDKKIEEFIENNRKKGKLPGIFVIIIKEGETVYQKGFGYSDLELQKPIGSEDLFEIGSNSKAFTALGILQLQKEGKLSIQDEVTKYIPWLNVKYKGEETFITIEQLLHHTSGIPFKTIDKIPVSTDTDALEKTVETLIGIELFTQPGEKFQYATINYDVLGLIIEKVSGETYEDYMESKVIKELGLNNTYISKTEEAQKHMTKGYKMSLLSPKLYEAPESRGNIPAGYILSCGTDMEKWLKIQLGLSEQTKFDQSIINESQGANRRVEPLSDGSSYAKGWFVYQDGGGVISHGGNNPNYSSFIVFKPEEKTGIVVLCNMNSDYVEVIGQGLIRIIDGEHYNKEIKDFNSSVDLLSVAIMICSFVILIITFLFLWRGLKEILRKERVFLVKGKESFIKLGLSLLFMVGLSYSIYLIPYILYEELSWRFVFIWLPDTVKPALYFFYATIWIVFLYTALADFFKKEGDKSLLIIVMLSILSGFGNALIIFTINMAIVSDNNMKLKLLVYFGLGIILYIYGQKIVRNKLINITNEIIYSKRIEVVKSTLKASYAQFEGLEKGMIESTLNNDTETIGKFSNIIIDGVTNAVTLIFCFMYLGFINKYALLLSFLIILLIASIYFLVGKYADKVGEESRDIQNVFFGFIQDLIGGFKELNINQKKKFEFEEDIKDSCNQYRIKKVKASTALANMFIVGELLFTVAIGAIALLFPIILKNLSTENITSYVFILLYMTGPVHGILDTIPDFIDVRISIKRINFLLDKIGNKQKEHIRETEGTIRQRNIVLKLNNVEYVYNKEDNSSFRIGPVSDEFKSGEIVFITGGNGSGKSTLAKLITGLYKPYKGNITINGIEVSEKLLGEHFSTVFSDFYLFHKLYGISNENTDEIDKYMKILQLDKKVQIKDSKFSTIKLSTGQKKRLALLVAYLEDKPILLFDEWAADQDPEFRQFFYHTLLPELKMKGKCIIAITHDDKYFNLADKVLKMDR